MRAAAERTDGAAARWAALQSLFEEALARDTGDRGAYLERACADAGTRAEVDALLAAHEGQGLLDVLACDVLAPLRAGGGRAAPATPPPALPALGRYRLLERLGGGGMGVVHRARDERLERDVALKFLSPHLSADEAAKKRFLVEARAAAALEHPNICTVHEIGETDDGQLYIVMACYDGETLDRRIARGPLPVGEALRVAAEIARGLAKAHERGIVHRDVKPANVVVTSDGLVKILDFGIAKLADVSVVQTVGIVGTVAYMSPEAAFGEVVDHRADIWALGVLLYEMLTGVRPFRGPGEQAILFAAMTMEPEPVTSARPDLPPELDVLLRRALAKRPADRFASAAELLAALGACPIGDPAAAPALPVRDDSALTRGGERRHATVVACTIAGHDALVERLPADDADRLLAQLRDAVTEVVTHHGGIVNHFSGDAFVALFGVPTAHEDDAVRAARAALALHARVTAIATPLEGRLGVALRLRTGVHTGAVVAQRLRTGDRRFRVTGAPVDVATRLAALADADAILASPEARRLAGPFVRTVPTAPVQLHADAPPASAHRVLGASDVRSRLEDVERGRLTPYAGRARELDALAELATAAAAGVGRLAVVVGEPGAGKSRLLLELRRRAQDAGVQVVQGRCDPYGGTPFLPFVRAVHDVLALPAAHADAQRHDHVVAAIRAIDPSLAEFLPLYLTLLAIPSAAHPVPQQLQGEHFQSAMLEAIAALFTLAARRAPLVVMLEDWHWADEASRAACRQLGEMVAAHPLLLVVTSRPDGAAEWGSAEHQLLLHLGPIDAAASATIIGAVLGAERVDAALTTRLHERTGGNPFFLEEICEALREDGAVVVREGTAAPVDGSDAVHLPETVQGVIRTRLDRLDEPARDVLRVAAVVGREFTRGLLEDVVEGAGELARRLERLKASGLVQQVAVVPEAAFRFKHALTEEVAYDSLLEHQRASLHAAVGRAIERRYAERLDEHVERLAHHFGRAGSWPEAVRYSLRAADRALALSQFAGALATLERAEQWLLRLPDDAGRRDVHADLLLREERLCESLGLRTRQLVLVERLIALLAPHGPSERLAQAYVRQGDAFTLLRRFEAADRALATAARMTGERGDGAGERSAIRSLALLRSHEGRHEEALVLVERVLALGRAAGDLRAEAGDLAGMANVLRAMGRHREALDVLETALERTEQKSNPVRYGALLNVIGTVHRELGDHERALEYFQRTSDLCAHPVHAAFTLPAIAHVQLQQGHVEEALATYREAVDINRRAGHADGSAHACRSLGEVLVGLERHAEALPALRDAARLFAQLEDRANEALMWRRIAESQERLGAPPEAHAAWARVRALLRGADAAAEAQAVEGLARTARQLPGDGDAALAHYDEALGLAARAGDAARELSLRNALGIAHWERGRYADALREYERALRLCRETGDRVHEGLILNSQGATLVRLRRWDEARTALDDGARVNAANDQPLLVAHARALLGDVCLALGELAEARRHVEASLAARRALRDRRGEGWMLERLARVLCAQARHDEARAAADAAGAIADEIGERALHDAITRLPIEAQAGSTPTG